jgi:hypothetical protein
MFKKKVFDDLNAKKERTYALFEHGIKILLFYAQIEHKKYFLE